MSSGASLSAPPSRLRWDVFLSFRGEDTRHNFTHQLYTALDARGVRVFIDNDGLTQGDSLDPILYEAIEDSAAAIAIISPRYASSRWCLEELARICEYGRMLLPVFYRVNPSDVRRQKGPFEEHFQNHERNYPAELVWRWRNAMNRVGGISGWVFLEENQGSKESDAIETLVEKILTKLSNTPEVVAPYVVGLEARLEKLWKLIDPKSKGIQVLGLFGMGGIGKTTLAKALFNKLVSHFSSHYFISDVRETSAKNGLVTVQNMLIQQFSNGEKPVFDEPTGRIVLKRVFREQRVLIVLDDIDDVTQLNALAASRGWFHEGSIIIISTRNREVLPAHLVNEIYEVKELDSSDSIKLLSFHALRREKPTETFLNLSREIVSLTGGLPLALEVYGSFLFDARKVKEWEEALQKLKQIRPTRLFDIIKISFDGLDKQQQCIFLDIASLLQSLKMTRDNVVDVLKGCGFGAESAISVLIARSLIKVTGENTFWMHDQIKDMGRQIIVHENLEDPGMRSRLWDRGDIESVLWNGKGTRNIQGITLDFEKRQQKICSAETIARHKFQSNLSLVSALTYLKEMFKDYFEHKDGGKMFSTKSFKPMINLRLLYINNVKLEGSLEHLPAELKWLKWRECPLKCLPSSCLRELTVLELSESKLRSIWGHWWWFLYNKKVEGKLTVMNLQGCCKLTVVPDLSGHPNLEKLILEGCVGLTKIHKSIGDMKKLVHLNMRRCSNLIEFPSDVSGLKCLKTLILSECLKLKELPQDMRSMSSLVELLLDETAIEKLPESIFHLTKLEILSMNKCQLLKRLPFCIGKLYSLRKLSLNGSSLEELPDSIKTLGNLEELSVMWCRSLTVIPDSVGDLKSLTDFFLDNCSVTEMPACIGSLYYLKVLSVGGCHAISKVPVTIGKLASIIELQLDGTSIVNLPDQIGSLKSLQKLKMSNCDALKFLPETIGKLLSLVTLIIVNSAIEELPESIGLLENLVMLRLNNCKHLYSLPSSFGNLKSLCHLYIEKTGLRGLPESFGMLSSLMVLKMGKERWARVPPDDKTLTSVALPSTFSNLSMLKVFDACAWKITGDIPNDFEKLSSLTHLNLGHNDFCHLPSSLKGLHFLEELNLSHCYKLRALPPLPSSLVKLNAANCISLDTISDLLNLEYLEDLDLSNCEKLADVPGLERLQSLIRLHMCGCRSCSPLLKEKLSKVALKKLKNLNMPGSETPHWLRQNVIRFSKHKNLGIRGIIVGIVISFNRQIPNNTRDQLPILIYAEILRLNMWVYKTAMKLPVPKTHEDQVYFCRYTHPHSLVSLLEDGDVLDISVNEEAGLKGVEVKQSGIHIIFENDDDYDGEEESLDETQLSVSGKFTKFIKHSEENSMLNSGNEAERIMPENGRREDPASSQKQRWLYVHGVVKQLFRWRPFKN